MLENMPRSGLFGLSPRTGGGGSSHEVTGEVSSYPRGGSGWCGRRKTKTFPKHITFSPCITHCADAKALQAGVMESWVGGAETILSLKL